MNTEQKHTLLPCPFCGGKAKEYERFNSNTVTCLVCGVKVRQSEMGQGDASERWNRRAALQSQDREDAEEIAATLATVLHFIPRREEPELYDDIDALCVQFSDHARSLREKENE